MRKTFKKSCVLAMATLMSLGVSTSFGCGETVKYDSTKTQLFVANYDGGVKGTWLKNAASRFESAYSNWEGDGNKVGVEVVVSNEKEFEGSQILTSMPGDTNEIYFTGSAQYYAFVSSACVRDLTSLVKDKTNATDGKTILSKMQATDVEALCVDGKYYGIPHYEITDGISYDAGLFKSAKLFFADEIDSEDTTFPGTRNFIVNANSKYSCGPNGLYGDYDDGLPSSYAELYKLIDKMYKSNTNAFVWQGGLIHYTNILQIGLANAFMSAEELQANVTFDSNGKEIDIVTGFNGDTPIIEKKAITKENAYLLKQSVANYYAMEFANKIYTDGSGYYDTECTSGTVSNYAAMDLFANSGLNGKKYDAMLIEGSYWYNEGTEDGVFERIKKSYPDTYQKKDIKWMSLPVQYAGTVEENKGKAPNFLAQGDSYCFVNKNIDDSKVSLAEEFISFCYSDDELVKFTEATNGITRRIKYDYSAALNNINSFGKSLLAYRTEAEAKGGYVIPFSNDVSYRRESQYFSRNITSGYWDSTVEGKGDYAYIYTAARNGISAKDYFNGYTMSAAEWNELIN